MARPLRIEFSGALYHITSRGDGGEKIFLNSGDKEYFLKLLCSTLNRFNMICHAYCLMDNHYHLLIETMESNLSRGMRHLNGVYTQAFNYKHHRSGHVFQGRYKAIIVEKDSYLLSVCRYIVLNPVRAGLVRNAKDWKWSSYNDTIEKEKSISCLTTDGILSQFGNQKNEAVKKYIKFVSEGLKDKFPCENIHGQLFLGKEKFVKNLANMLKDKKDIKEIPKTQRYAARPLLNDFFNNVKMKDKKQKEKMMYEAYVKHGYSLKEIAHHLSIHYTTVSQVINRVEKSRENTL